MHQKKGQLFKITVNTTFEQIANTYLETRPWYSAELMTVKRLSALSKRRHVKKLINLSTWDFPTTALVCLCLGVTNCFDAKSLLDDYTLYRKENSKNTAFGFIKENLADIAEYTISKTARYQFLEKIHQKYRTHRPYMFSKERWQMFQELVRMLCRR